MLADLEAQTLSALRTLPLPPRIAGEFAAFCDRVGVRPGYFTHPLALPILQLSAWLGAPAARLPTLALASATGYLAVRLQDDLIDEGIGEPGTVTLLAGLLLHHHDAALAELTPGPAFWALSRQTWAAYAEAMLVERDLHAGADYTAARFSGVLDRSRPLILPAAASLHAAGRTAELERLHVLVDALVRAHQLHTDLLDIEADFLAGRRTWLLAQLGTPDSLASLRRVLLLEGGLERLTEQVVDAFSAVEQCEVAPATALAQQRVAAVRALKQRIQTAYLSALLG